MKLPSWLEWLDGMAGMNRVWLVLLAGWERNRELVKRKKPRMISQLKCIMTYIMNAWNLPHSSSGHDIYHSFPTKPRSKRLPVEIYYICNYAFFLALRSASPSGTF
jgi:hypothetical protein